MNYEKIYYDFCSSRQRMNREKNKGTYFERHHIKPKSLFPELKKENDVKCRFNCLSIFVENFFEKPDLKVKGFFTFKVHHGRERKEGLHCRPKDWSSRGNSDSGMSKGK